MRKICCFAGHREIYCEENLFDKSKEVAEKLIVEEKVNEFWFGNYGYFDAMWASAVRELKGVYHDIPALLIEKFVLYRIREILTSDMYKERFEEQLKIRLETLQTKKKDILEIKGNITKLTNQKEKLLGLILEEESKEIIETYREKLNSILNQISVQNELLNVYSELDIKEEENLLRGKFKEFYSDISYKDFQELDREQQKTLFNNLIEKITIDELDIPDEKETCLSITIYMKIPGYEPKLSLQFKKDLKNSEKKKTNSYSKNKSSSIDGGEGGI